LDASSTAGYIKTITLTGNCTFTLTGATSGLVGTLQLVLTQDGTGGRTVTWPGSVQWPSGAAPALPSAAGAVERVTLTTYDGGTTWYGTTASGSYSTTVTQNLQSGTTYTVVLTDAGKVVEMANAALNTLTVPPNSTAAYPVGTFLHVRQGGVGQTVIAPGAGVTLRSRGGALKLTGQWSEATLTKRAADEWVVTGELTL
jgi:hypothetical protein